MQVSINEATYNGNALQALTNMTIGFYMISGTNVGNFQFPQLVQTTFTPATGQVAKQSINPYSPDGSGAAFQLVAWPGGFPKTAGVVSLPKLKMAK